MLSCAIRCKRIALIITLKLTLPAWLEPTKHDIQEHSNRLYNNCNKIQENISQHTDSNTTTFGALDNKF